MEPITFFVEGQPKGQPRPRAFARNIGGKYTARVFTPGTAEAWKSSIAYASLKYKPAFPINGPVSLVLCFYFQRPKSHFRANGDIKLAAPIAHTGKPDTDNLAKAVMDVLTQLLFWHDDSQVTALLVRKEWGVNGCKIEVAEAVQ